MKKFKALILGLVGASSVASAEVEMKYYPSAGDVFELQAPADWQQNANSDYLSISSPGGSVSITASAYSKNGGSLEEFAEYRFSSVQDFYTPQTEVRSIESGVLREYEGVWPGDPAPTYYAVAAVEVGKAFVSITVVTDRKDYGENKPMYIKIFETIKVNS